MALQVNSFMRSIICLSLVLCFSIVAEAQISYITPTARSFGIGVGGGVTLLQGDVDDLNPAPAGRVNLEYNITPFINIGVEGQLGKLSSGEERPNDRYSRVNFKAANVNIRFASGQFFRNKLRPGNILGGLYAGVGLGFVSSEVEEIGAVVNNEAIKGIVLESNALTVPLNLGINLDLPSLLGRHNLIANINYQYNFVQGEELDGYAYKSEANLSFDGYSFISLGLKYNFGALSNR